MSATKPPNLTAIERDTYFPMYNWLKLLRNWLIKSFDGVYTTLADYVLLVSPSGGQTLTGQFTFDAGPHALPKVVHNTPVETWSTLKAYNTIYQYSPDSYSYGIYLDSTNAGVTTLMDLATTTKILEWTSSTKYLETQALRIVGDFGNSVITDRTSLIPNADNQPCHFQLIPRGTSNTASIRVYSGEDLANASVATFGVNTATEVRINSFKNGTASFLPVCFYINSVECFRIDNDGRISGKYLHNNAGSLTGTTQGYIASGTYTPTATNVTNATAGTCEVAKWTRLGNVVSVSGRMSLTPTVAATTTVWGLSLPIASGFTNTSDLNGLVHTGLLAAADRPGVINADTTNDRANLSIRSSSAAAEDYYYMFQYEVL